MVPRPCRSTFTPPRPAPRASCCPATRAARSRSRRSCSTRRRCSTTTAGLWGYTGASLADGEPLTIQSTGMGGPSAAIVLRAGRPRRRAGGPRRDVRRARPARRSATLVVAARAVAGDGTSRALGADGVVAADPALTAALGRRRARRLDRPLLRRQRRALRGDRRGGGRDGGRGAVPGRADPRHRRRLRPRRLGHVVGGRERLGRRAIAEAGERVGRAERRALVEAALRPIAGADVALRTLRSANGWTGSRPSRAAGRRSSPGSSRSSGGRRRAGTGRGDLAGHSEGAADVRHLRMRHCASPTAAAGRRPARAQGRTGARGVRRGAGRSPRRPGGVTARPSPTRRGPSR